jgi:hypothetical protein
LTCPVELEKEGSCAQKSTIEPLLETDTTCSLLVGKEMVALAAFIATSGDDTFTDTAKFVFLLYEPDLGEMFKFAASAKDGEETVIKLSNTKKLFLIFF